MPSQFSRLDSSLGLLSEEQEKVLGMYRALFEGVLEEYKKNLSWAQACRLAGVEFHKFKYTYETDLVPGGFREKCEILYSEALDLAKGVVMAQVIHEGSLQAARIILDPGRQINVNIDNGQGRITAKVSKKTQESLNQIPDKEAQEFIRKYGEDEAMEAEFRNG